MLNKIGIKGISDITHQKKLNAQRCALYNYYLILSRNAEIINALKLILEIKSVLLGVEVFEILFILIIQFYYFVGLW